MTITTWLVRHAVGVAFAASVGSSAVLATTSGSVHVDRPTPGNGTHVRAASNGDIVIGSTATNGDIHVNPATADDAAVIFLAKTGDVRIGRATSDPDSGGQVSAVLGQHAPPTIRD